MTRPAPRIPRTILAGRRRPNPKRAALHLAFVRDIGICLACGSRGRMEAAHVRKGTDGGTGTKPSDRYSVPLDTECHARQHRSGEVTFWGELGVDPLNISLRLWTVSGDVDAGRRIVERSLLTRGIATTPERAAMIDRANARLAELRAKWSADQTPSGRMTRRIDPRPAGTAPARRLSDITRDAMVTIVAEHCNCTQLAAREALAMVFDTVAGTVARGGKVRIIELGTFERRAIAARKGRNPRTGEAVEIAPTTRVSFHQSGKMRDRLAAVSPTPAQRAAE